MITNCIRCGPIEVECPACAEALRYERTIYWAKADRPHWGDPVSRAVSRMAPDGWEFVRVGEEDEDREEIPVHFRRPRSAGSPDN